MFGSIVNGVKKFLGFSTAEEAKPESAVKNQAHEAQHQSASPSQTTKPAELKTLVVKNKAPVNNIEIKQNLEKSGSINQASQKPYTFISKLDGIAEYKLKNGLKVILKQDNTVPLINTELIYHVGSKNDPPDKTGMAHFVEHLMFSGSEMFGDGEIWEAVELNGGSLNALTSHDATTYKLSLPFDKLELALKLEADRMRGILFDESEIKKERDVIFSEIDETENDPSELLTEALLKTAYKEHPYGHSIAGTKDHLSGIKKEDIKAFYDKYYQPDNATLIISGNFIKDGLEGKGRVLKLVDKYFGKIPASALKKEELSPEPKQTEARKLVLEKTSHEKLVGISYPIEKSMPYKDSVALKLLSIALFMGNNSRLYTRTHQEDSIAIQPSGSVLENIDSKNYFINIDAGKYVDLDSIQEIIDQELEKVIEAGLTEEEMTKLKGLIESGEIYKRDRISTDTNLLSYFAARGDWKNYPKFLETVKSVTNEDIKRVAKQVFNKNARSIVHLKPAKDNSAKKLKESKAKEHHSKKTAPFDEAKLHKLSKLSMVSEKIDSKSAIDFKAEKVSLENGAKVMLKEDKKLPLLFINIKAPGGELLDPPEKPGIAGLMIATILRSGTKDRNQFEFAKACEALACSFGIYCTVESFCFNASVLKSKLDESLKLMNEFLNKPNFNEFEFESQKRSMIAEIKQADEDPDFVARRALSQKLYPKGHPLYIYSPREQIEIIKRYKLDDVKKFWKEKFKTAAFNVSVAGDISMPEFKSKIAPIINSWNNRKARVEVPAIPGVVKEEDLLKEPTEFKKASFIANNAKPQTEVRLAQNCPITRDHPDFYAMLLANSILGGSLRSRLSVAIREDKGLTYGISSDFLALNKGPGSFNISFGCNPKDIMATAGALNEELEKFYKDGVTEAELEAAKRSFRGSYFIDNFSSRKDISSLMSSWLFRGTDEKDIKKRLFEIDKLSTKDEEGKININKVIRKYMNPKRFNTVIVGPEIKKEAKEHPAKEPLRSPVPQKALAAV